MNKKKIKQPVKQNQQQLYDWQNRALYLADRYDLDDESIINMINPQPIEGPSNYIMRNDDQIQGQAYRAGGNLWIDTNDGQKLVSDPDNVITKPTYSTALNWNDTKAGASVLTAPFGLFGAAADMILNSISNRNLDASELGISSLTNAIYGTKTQRDFYQYKADQLLRNNPLDRRGLKYLSKVNKLDKRFGNLNKYQGVISAMNTITDAIQYGKGDDSLLNKIEMATDIGGIIGATNILEHLPGKYKPVGWMLDKVLDYAQPTTATFDVLSNSNNLLNDNYED